jgi:hypothetical protein
MKRQILIGMGSIVGLTILVSMAGIVITWWEERTPRYRYRTYPLGETFS